MGGGGIIDRCVCMAESLCYSSVTITTLLIGYTLIRNKKVKVQKEKKNKQTKKKDTDHQPNKQPKILSTYFYCSARFTIMKQDWVNLTGIYFLTAQESGSLRSAFSLIKFS